MKGIVLAGGNGTRLFPLTRSTSKHLLPVHDKAMVFYPLSILLLMGIREIAIVSRPKDLPAYRSSLEFLESLGVSFTYVEQPQPGGIPEGILLCESFSVGESTATVLGDNFFFGSGLMSSVRREFVAGARIFTSRVPDPSRFGVLERNDDGSPLRIEEKPSVPRSNQAVVGLYVFDSTVFDRAKSLERSRRGELEVADLINSYLNEDALNATELARGTTWFDMGTFKSIEDASSFVKLVQDQGDMVACLEEICLRMGFTSTADLRAVISEYPESDYRRYLERVVGQADA